MPTIQKTSRIAKLDMSAMISRTIWIKDLKAPNILNIDIPLKRRQNIVNEIISLRASLSATATYDAYVI